MVVRFKSSQILFAVSMGVLFTCISASARDHLNGNDVKKGICIEANIDKGSYRPKRKHCDAIMKGLESGATSEWLAKLKDRNIKGMEKMCPDYRERFAQDNNARDLMRVLVSGLVTKESAWKEQASGDGGNSKGICQLNSRTAAPWGGPCRRLKTSNAEQSLQCCAHMVVQFIAKDGVVGEGSGDLNARGIARNFGPFRPKQAKKRAHIETAVREYCKSNPMPRAPASLAEYSPNPTAF